MFKLILVKLIMGQEHTDHLQNCRGNNVDYLKRSNNYTEHWLFKTNKWQQNTIKAGDGIFIVLKENKC